MKVLSLLQPWASLVVLGHKEIETRSFNTKHRGPLFIHASAGKKLQYRNILLDFQQEFFGLQSLRYSDLPFGAIIGKVNLIDTERTNNLIDPGIDRVIKMKLEKDGNIGDQFEYIMTKQEKAFGDYSPNRFGWLLSDPVAFAQPIPAKGKLGIWNYDMPDRFHYPNQFGGHSTFTSPATKMQLDVINKMSEVAYKDLFSRLKTPFRK